MMPPKPPAYIAAAIAEWHHYGPDVQWTHHRCAQMVWDALLAEGRVRYIARSHLYMDGPHSGDETILVIPLGDA